MLKRTSIRLKILCAGVFGRMVVHSALVNYAHTDSVHVDKDVEVSYVLQSCYIGCLQQSLFLGTAYNKQFLMCH
jgi:hypothetical protein